MSKAFNSKISLEFQLPTTSKDPKLRSANEFLLSALRALSSVSAKLSGFINENLRMYCWWRTSSRHIWRFVCALNNIHCSPQKRSPPIACGRQQRRYTYAAKQSPTLKRYQCPSRPRQWITKPLFKTTWLVQRTTETTSSNRYLRAALGFLHKLCTTWLVGLRSSRRRAGCLTTWSRRKSTGSWRAACWPWSWKSRWVMT